MVNAKLMKRSNRKGKDFDQGTTITLIKPLKKEDTKTFTNKLNMNKLEYQVL